MQLHDVGRKIIFKLTSVFVLFSGSQLDGSRQMIRGRCPRYEAKTNFHDRICAEIRFDGAFPKLSKALQDTSEQA